MEKNFLELDFNSDEEDDDYVPEDSKSLFYYNIDAKEEKQAEM